jgi:uncharacterized protein (TIGR03437 family)
VSIGGAAAEVLFAGLIYPGVMQVNVRLPQDAPPGDSVAVVLGIGTAFSRKTATIAIR